MSRVDTALKHYVYCFICPMINSIEIMVSVYIFGYFSITILLPKMTSVQILLTVNFKKSCVTYNCPVLLCDKQRTSQSNLYPKIRWRKRAIMNRQLKETIGTFSGLLGSLCSCLQTQYKTKKEQLV